MGRSPCCDKVGLKKGPWTPEEDQKLLAYIEEHGHGSWRALPAKAGLQRCGKSCRLRWTNYLRPDIKRGKFSLHEEQTIIQLHALLGNRWSAIATHLLRRTDNEIKNYWNTHLKKRLAKMGIDPVTHKSKNEALLSSDGQSKNAANLSHMAQWESARLEAEARLVRESKLRSHSSFLGNPTFAPPSCSSSSCCSSSSSSSASSTSIDVFKVWNNGITASRSAGNCDLESPTSALTFYENVPMSIAGSAGVGGHQHSVSKIKFVGSSCSSVKEEGEQEWKIFENSVSFQSNLHDITLSMDGAWSNGQESLRVEEGFTNLLINNSGYLTSLSGSGPDSESRSGNENDSRNDHYYEDNKNYWNSILNLVNSSPSDSPLF